MDEKQRKRQKDGKTDIHKCREAEGWKDRHTLIQRDRKKKDRKTDDIHKYRETADRKTDNIHKCRQTERKRGIKECFIWL